MYVPIKSNEDFITDALVASAMYKRAGTSTASFKFGEFEEEEDPDAQGALRVPDEADMEELKNSIWHEIADTNNRWSGIEKSLRKGEYDFNLTDEQIKEIKWYINYRLEMVNMVANSSLRFSADVSDQVPPMGWNSEENPSGAGPAKPPLDRLQQNPDEDNDSNVLYDSGKDTGGQFQTTINPKDKSVTVKFLDSPQKQNLDNAINQQQGPLPQLNTKPPQQQQQSGPQGNSAQEFNEQNIPAEF
jgi:hypothetical protein